MKRLLQISMLLGLSLMSPLALLAQGPGYPGYPSWYGPNQGQYQYPQRQQYPSSTPSQAPNTSRYQNSPYSPWGQQRQPGYNQPTYQTTPTVKLTTRIAETSPFVQENVLLYLTIESSHNLATATPQLPQAMALAFQLLDGPTATSKKNSKQVTTEFIYQLTPLRSGTIEIPPIHVSGEIDLGSSYGGKKQTFDVAGEKSLILNVKPARSDSTPWLPLEQLVLEVSLPNGHQAVAGQPISLTVEMNAIGTSGNQLPSLESQMENDAFHAYRERTKTSTQLNKKQGKILGRRVETYTLVPQYGGELKLPELRLAWWNTRNDMPQYVSVPLRPIAVKGRPKSSNLFNGEDEGGLFPTGPSAAFWIPLSIILGILFGYWLAVWIMNRRKENAPPPAFPQLSQALKKPFIEMAPAFKPFKERWTAATSCLNPITRWQRIRRRLIAALPLSIRFWFCVRCVDEENDPDVWGFSLRFLANKHLDLPPRAPFAHIADKIIEFQPRANRHKVDHLIHQLDQAVYGKEVLDFERWKEEFKHEIRPRMPKLTFRRQSSSPKTNRNLPDLNPAA